jgi:hypothetical protein
VTIPSTSALLQPDMPSMAARIARPLQLPMEWLNHAGLMMGHWSDDPHAPRWRKEVVFFAAYSDDLDSNTGVGCTKKFVDFIGLSGRFFDHVSSVSQLTDTTDAKLAHHLPGS